MKAPHRGLSIYCPGETVGAALVTSFVLRFDRERVTALAQARVSLAARAGTEGAAIQLAQEAHPRLCVGEAEAGAGLVRRVSRLRGDRWCRRQRGVDRPGETVGAALVTSFVLGFDRERVTALAQARVSLAARAGTEGATIQLT